MKKAELKEDQKENKKYWFRRKLYGWGWFPVTWQGWLITLFFILIMLLNGYFFNYRVSNIGKPTKFDWFLFYGIIILSTLILILICYKKGEKPKWSWGK